MIALKVWSNIWWLTLRNQYHTRGYSINGNLFSRVMSTISTNVMLMSISHESLLETQYVSTWQTFHGVKICFICFISERFYTKILCCLTFLDLFGTTLFSDYLIENDCRLCLQLFFQWSISFVAYYVIIPDLTIKQSQGWRMITFCTSPIISFKKKKPNSSYLLLFHSRIMLSQR